MEEGDLITTPNWTWHDHYNGSDESVIWLDGLDVRLLAVRLQSVVNKKEHAGFLGKGAQGGGDEALSLEMG